MVGRFLALAGRVPPKEFQLWSIGDNPTDMGMHRWTERSVRDVFARYAERGNPILLDIDHNVGKAMAKDVHPAVPNRTAGYAHLELRDGAPWLRFEWSDEGKRQITSGERRFLSPEYDTDEATGEITCLYRVSLVSDPGTHHARHLASTKGHAMDPVTLAALKACLSAEDPKAAIEALLEELGKAGAAGAAESPSENDAGAAPPAEEGGEKPQAYAAGSGAPEGGEGGGDKPKETPVVSAAAAGAGGKAAGAAAASSAAPPPVVPKLGKAVANVTGADSAAAGQGLDEASQRQLAAATGAGKEATLAVDGLRRDILVRENAERIPLSLRKWASAQSLAVVESYLASLPSEPTAPAQPNAVQGARPGQAGRPVRHMLQGEARKEFEKMFSEGPLPPIGPRRRGDGKLEFVTGCPSEYRAQTRTQTPGASAGK